MRSTPQERSVRYARMHTGGRWQRFAVKILKRLRPGIPGFELVCGDIGPRLTISHGYASVIWAQRIGADCEIFQQVTIGRKEVGGHLPILGDRVTVGPGAIVIGRVELGNDAVIGAGAVVTRSVAARAKVAGVPARETR